VPDLAGYAFVGFVAAVVTTLTTPIVRWVALRFGWVVPPDDRRMHTQPTPAIGGVAMFLGLGAAMGAAWQMDRFSTLFNGNSEPFGVP
jgi:UDP-GlcNAc:undecaprenyl-phosphate/decaprenyl-phosphate GlcNAc-1-phosphate transferase